MVQTIQAKEINLRYLIEKFSLQRVRDNQFFIEWQDNLPEITDLQKHLFDQVQEGYFNLLEYPPMLEDVVRMAVLDPILFIGEFYLAPFYVKSEEYINIAVEDEQVIIKGKIDTLVLKDHLWVMVIESKQAAFSVEVGLAQILAYMLSDLNAEKPSYGMITTGGTFIFVKLIKGETPQYATSQLFSTHNHGDLYRVLAILKHFIQIVIDFENN